MPDRQKLKILTKAAACLLLAGLCLLTGACWDRVEIQERGMVKAIALDVYEADSVPPNVRQAETFVQPYGSKQIRMSFQVIKLSPSSSRKGHQQENTFVLSNSGRSLHEITNDTLGQVSKKLDFGHLDTVIISETLLRKEGLRPVIDFFRRSPTFRWRIRLYVTPGDAVSILNFKPPTGEPGGQYIANIANNQVQNSHIPVARSDMGFVAIALDNGCDIFLPRLELADGMLKMGGGAAFIKDRFVGYLDEHAVEGLRLARSTQKSGSITIPCPAYPDNLMSLNFICSQTSYAPSIENGKLTYLIKLEVHGNLQEYQCNADCRSVKPEQIPELEEAFAREISKNIEYGLRSTQALGVDPNGFFAARIQAREPAYWNKVKDRWPEIFSTTPFYISTRVTIRNIGEHR